MKTHALQCLLLGIFFLPSNVFGQSNERPIPPETQKPYDTWEPQHNVRNPFTSNDPLFSDQWHLDSTTLPNINVTAAWLRDVTGAGVTIGIADDGLEGTHPDLAPNFNLADSWDFGQGDNDPAPVYNNPGGDNHGTSVTGVAGARGGNAEGVSGVAPLANVAGLRIDFPFQSLIPMQFENATRYRSDGMGADGSNIQVKNHSYGIAVPYIPATGQVAALRDSAGNDTIHAFAAGNERHVHGFYIEVSGDDEFTPDVDVAVDGDANKKATQSAQESIAVAALADDGTFSFYSNFGANVFVTAPSNGGSLGITTTDRVGSEGYDSSDYTDTFGGTSSASPVIAGVMALGVQANPALDERFAKHLLVRTSDMVDPGNPSWQTNGAGNEFSQDYGFGLVNADAFTQAAEMYVDTTPLVIEETGNIIVGEDIIGAGGNTDTFLLATPGELEEVEVTLDINHTWRGDLEAYLTSPAGTESRLMMSNLADSFDGIDWTFVSNEFWGESPLGEWSLEIIDTEPSFDDGFWNSYSVKAKTGTLVVPEPSGLALAALAFAGLCVWIRRRRSRA